MKRILLITNNSGGLAMFRKELILSLNEKYEVVASCPRGNRCDELELMNCRILDTAIDRRGINPLKDFKLLLDYNSILKTERPDYVITYTIKPNIYAGMMCRVRKIKYAANITGLGTVFQKDSIIKRVAIRLYRMALKKAEVVFFENSDSRRIFIENTIVKEKKTHLLNGAGVNLDRFCLLPYPEENVERCFLFVGRVMKEKGIEELIAAFKRINENGRKCKLLIVGNCENEGYKEIMQEGISNGWIKYFGFQLDVKPYIQMSHCFILPSWHEGMANTNLENAASGRPIITSNIPGCREAVIEGISGYTVDCKDVDSIYTAVNKILEKTNAELKEMGLNGRKHMEKNFDKRIIVEETITSLGL